MVLGGPDNVLYLVGDGMHRWVATKRGAKAMGFVVILAHKFIPLLVCSTVLGLGREQIIVRNLMVMSSPMPGECDQWVMEDY
jgi:hypothetical protein